MLAFEGWNDAADAASGSVNFLIEQLGSTSESGALTEFRKAFFRGDQPDHRAALFNPVDKVSSLFLRG